jgi:hypothetical protein
MFLYVVIKETLQDSETSFKIDVIDANTNNPNKLADDSNYPLCFSIMATNFKQQIATMKEAEKITIQKGSDTSISLIAEKNRGRLNLEIQTSFPINAMLNMRSRIVGDEIFAATVNIENIRRFGTKIMGETVRVCAHARDKITFSTTTKEKEGGVFVKIFVEHAVYDVAN